MRANSYLSCSICRSLLVFALLSVSSLTMAQSNGEIVKLPFYVTDGILKNEGLVVDNPISGNAIDFFSFGPIEITISGGSWFQFTNSKKEVDRSIAIGKGGSLTFKNVDSSICVKSVSWERTTTDAIITGSNSIDKIETNGSIVSWTSPSIDVQQFTANISDNLMRITRFEIEYENLAHQILKKTVNFKDLELLLEGPNSEFKSWDGKTSYWGKVEKARTPDGEIIISCPKNNPANASVLNRFATITPNGLEVKGENVLEVIQLVNPKAKMVAFSMEANVGTVLDTDTARLFVNANPGSLYCVNTSPRVTTDWGYVQGTNEVILTPRNKEGADAGPIWQTLDIYYYLEEESLPASKEPIIKGKEKFVDEAVIVMSTDVPNTKIYYTTNGIDPDVKVLSNGNVQVNSAELYNGTGITISETTEFRALSVTEGHNVSSVVQAKFEKLAASVSPTISGDEKFENNATVTISTSENDATLYYTIDGSDPQVDYIDGNWSPSQNTLKYSREITINSTTIIKAISIAEGHGPSDLVEKTFIQMPRTSAPNLGLSGEQLFSDYAEVNLKDIPEGAIVFYTLNGSNPTFTEEGSPVATGETHIAENGIINIKQTCVLTVVIWEQGKLPSEPLSLQFTKTTATSTPNIEGEHHFINSTTVTITSTDNSSIYYTTDGSEPIAASTDKCYFYAEPLILSRTATVKAIAVANGLLPSAVASRTFTQWEITQSPKIIGERTFIDNTSVSIEGVTGSKIYYTLDSTNPSFIVSDDGTVAPESGTYLFSELLTLTSNCVVKAVAVLDGHAPSDIEEVSFVKLERSAMPEITAPRIFFEEAIVTINAANNAKIFYTTDGSDPEVKLIDDNSVSGHLYESPLVLTSPTTIKALAWEEGKASSDIVTAQLRQALRTPKPKVTLPVEFDENAEIIIEAQDARIFYTIGSDNNPDVKISEEDGSLSWSGETKEYTSPISVQSTSVVKAVAVSTGLRVSEMVESTTTKLAQTLPPKINGDNPFVREAEVVLEAPITARILYTLDGTIPEWELDPDGVAAPKEGSTTQRYERNSVLKIKERTILKAVAHEKGKTVSEVVSETFVPADATPAPKISGRNPFAISSEVTISAENDAKIFYTTDGSDPDVTGTWYIPTPTGSTQEYTVPFSLKVPMVIKAVAWKNLSSVSAVTEVDFRQFAKCETPEISGETPFTTESEISIIGPEGVEIFYSLDGSSPSAFVDDNGVITGGPFHYEGPFKISDGTVVKAVAVGEQLLPSDIAIAEFVKLGKTSQPVIIAPELFGDMAEVRIGVPEGAIVRYTLDGSDPGEESPLYEDILTVVEPCEIRARAWTEGYQPSNISVLEMRQMERSGLVEISGTSPFVREIIVTLSAAPEAKIYYTIDGTVPSVKVVGADKVEVSDNAILYDAPLNIKSDTHIIAVALEASKRVGEPSEREFVRAGVTAKPVIDGVTPFMESTTVTITADPGAEIYFTLDGTEPTQSSTHYIGSFQLNYNAIVKAIAKHPALDFSEVVEMNFEKVGLSEKPVVEAPALFGDEAHVRISGDGAIWYTLDGTNPQPEESYRYEEELVFREPFTIKAIAQSEGKLVSEVVEHTGNQMERTTEVKISGQALFDDSTEVSLSAEGTIWYTLEGTIPDIRIVDDGEPIIGEGAILYTEPFEISSSLTLTAVALESGKRASIASQRAFERMDQSTAPTISGTTPFDSNTLVTITAQSGAMIYYTIDGTRPQPGNTSTLQYSAPFSVTATTLVRAVAVEENKAISPIAEILFESMAVSNKPEIEVVETFGDEADVKIVAASEARIFFTVDGTIPDKSSSEYTGPFVISSSSVIRAVALEEGKTLSMIDEREANQMDQTDSPEIRVEEWNDGSFRVTFDTKTDGTVYYSLENPVQLTLRNHDDLIIGDLTKEYSQPVKLSGGDRIYAIAIVKGCRPSDMILADMLKRESVTAPVIEGISSFEETSLVSMSAEEGMKIFYTTDGKDPEVVRGQKDEPLASGSSTKEYYIPFEISESTVVKAVATGIGKTVSEVSERNFKKLEKTLAPVILAPEFFGDEAEIKVNVPEGIVVRYTLNGSDPDESSELYVGPFIVDSPVEVRMRAWNEGYTKSDVAILSMHQMERSDQVVISGTSPFVREATVTLIAAPQARIYYSIDGVPPVIKVISADKVEVSENALLYTEPLKINSEFQIIAVALEESKRASEPVERRFERAGVTIKPSITGITPFIESTLVTITAVQGADIYYTLDGSEPTSSSLHYTDPFSINGSVLVKAVAKLPQLDFSDVVEMRFEKEVLSEKPFIAAPELFGDEAHVKIKGDGRIWFTLDGTDPIPDASERYVEELVLTEPFTIKAIAQSEGKLPSEVVEHAGNQMERSASAVISGDDRYYGSSQVTIEAGGADVWYTLDGSIPSVLIIDAGEPQISGGAIRYSGPFTISSSLTVSAVAIEPGKRASLASQRAFVRLDQSNEPDISGETPFPTQTTVTITARSGAKIYFTLDGTRPEPGKSSTFLYQEPLLLTTTTLVRAIAVEEGKAVSPVAEKLFEHMTVSKKPEVKVAELFGDEADVEISAAQGARIFYTVDGTMPDESSAEYTGPFVISSSGLIRAVALENGKSLSVMTEKEVRQMDKTSAPEIGVEEWNDGSFRVTVTAPSDAAVYYSVDEPAQLTLRNESSLIAGNSTMLYSEPVRAEAGVRFYAMALKPGYRPSEIMATSMPERESVLAPVIEGDSPFEVSTIVSISAEEGLKIFYTTDGKNPEIVRGQDDEPLVGNSSTSEYYVPFEITGSMVIKAIAVGVAKAMSPLASKEFVLSDKSGIDVLLSDDDSIKIGSGSISGPADMKVYDAWGRLCPHEGLRPGVYIIVIGDRRLKVMVKS